jgi:membrane protease YdiL (CAAX protease family)
MSQDGIEAQERRDPPRAEAAKARTPGIGSVLASLAAGFALATLLGAAASLLIPGSLAAIFFLAEVGLLAGVVLYLKASGHDVATAMKTGPVPTAVFPLAIRLGGALLLANIAASALLGPPARDLEIISGSHGVVERIVLAISVILAAPVIEEALFRGLLQGTLETRMRPWFAIIAAALPFALLHGPRPALFFFFWSLPVGWVTWRTSSIRPGIVVHAINNLVGLIGLFAAGSLETEPVEQSVGAIVVSTAVLALAAMWTVRLCGRIADVAKPNREPLRTDR